MPKRRHSRARHSEKQWGAILKQFDSSGLSAREFCQREDLSLSSFQRWRNRLGSTAATKFVELVPAVQPIASSSSWSSELS